MRLKGASIISFIHEDNFSYSQCIDFYENEKTRMHMEFVANMLKLEHIFGKYVLIDKK